MPAPLVRPPNPTATPTVASPLIRPRPSRAFAGPVVLSEHTCCWQRLERRGKEQLITDPAPRHSARYLWYNTLAVSGPARST